MLGFFGSNRPQRWPPWPLIRWDIYNFYSVAEHTCIKLYRDQVPIYSTKFEFFRVDVNKDCYPCRPLIGWKTFASSSLLQRLNGIWRNYMCLKWTASILIMAYNFDSHIPLLSHGFLTRLPQASYVFLKQSSHNVPNGWLTPGTIIFSVIYGYQMIPYEEYQLLYIFLHCREPFGNTRYPPGRRNERSNCRFIWHWFYWSQQHDWRNRWQWILWTSLDA